MTANGWLKRGAAGGGAAGQTLADHVDVHYDTYHAAIGFSERSYDGVPFEEKIRKELEPTTQNVNYPIAEVIIGRRLRR